MEQVLRGLWQVPRDPCWKVSSLPPEEVLEMRLALQADQKTPTPNHASFDFRALPLPSPIIVLDKFSHWYVPSIVSAAQLPSHRKKEMREGDLTPRHWVLAQGFGNREPGSIVLHPSLSQLLLLKVNYYSTMISLNTPNIALSYRLSLRLQRSRPSLATNTSIWRQAHYSFKLEWNQEALGWFILPGFYS